MMSAHVHNPPRPGLFLSARQEFLERGFQTNISRRWLSKKRVSMLFTELLLLPCHHLDHNEDRAAAFSTYLVNDDLEHTWMWNVRTNNCVRTNICKKSVFAVSIRNINIYGRILTQFTGLLPTNIVTAKRDLLAERTCVKNQFQYRSLRKGLRHLLTERYRNWISWYLDVSSSWCWHFQYLGFLTGAPVTNFALKSVKTRYLTLFRATKNSVVICRESLFYEMGYPFRSTVFVPMEF